jgi:hypothetical protein
MKKMIVLILIIQSVVFWHLSGMLNEVRQTTHSEASVDAIRWKVSFEVNDEVKELLRQARENKVRT